MPGTAASGGRRTSAKSRAELERAGTFRKDRHGDLRNPEPTTGRPDVPGNLDEIGQQAWDWLMWAFEDMGMLAKVDAHGAYAYCRIWAKTLAVEQQQAEMRASLTALEENIGDDMTMSDRVALFGQIVTLQKLIAKCTDQSRSGWMAIRQYLVEFGLTPSSRGRIKLPAKAEKQDEFEKHQKLLRRVK